MAGTVMPRGETRATPVPLPPIGQGWLKMGFAPLCPQERHALRYICDFGDYIDTPAGRVLVVPLPDEVAVLLEAFEADVNEAEPEIDDSDDTDHEEDDVDEDDDPAGGNVEDEGEACGTDDEPVALRTGPLMRGVRLHG